MEDTVNTIKVYQKRIDTISELIKDYLNKIEENKDEELNQELKDLKTKLEILNNRRKLKKEIMKTAFKNNISLSLIILIISLFPSILLPLIGNISFSLISIILFCPAILAFIINSYVEYQNETVFIKEIETQNKNNSINHKLLETLKKHRQKELIINDLKSDISSLKIEKNNLEEAISNLMDILFPVNNYCISENREIKR